MINFFRKKKPKEVKYKTVKIIEYRFIKLDVGKTHVKIQTKFNTEFHIVVYGYSTQRIFHDRKDPCVGAIDIINSRTAAQGQFHTLFDNTMISDDPKNPTKFMFAGDILLVEILHSDHYESDETEAYIVEKTEAVND